jgi:hypothetical protein
MSLDLREPIERIKAALLVYNLTYTVSEEGNGDTTTRLRRFSSVLKNDSERFGIKSFYAKDGQQTWRKRRRTEEDCNDSGQYAKELNVHGYEVESEDITDEKGGETTSFSNVWHSFRIAVFHVNGRLLRPLLIFSPCFDGQIQEGDSSQKKFSMSQMNLKSSELSIAVSQSLSTLSRY